MAIFRRTVTKSLKLFSFYLKNYDGRKCRHIPSTLSQVDPDIAIPLLVAMNGLREELLAESSEEVPDMGGEEDHWCAKQAVTAFVQRFPLVTTTLMTQFYYKQAISTREFLQGPLP